MNRHTSGSVELLLLLPLRPLLLLVLLLVLLVLLPLLPLQLLVLHRHLLGRVRLLVLLLRHTIRIQGRRRGASLPPPRLPTRLIEAEKFGGLARACFCPRATSQSEKVLGGDLRASTRLTLNRRQARMRW